MSNKLSSRLEVNKVSDDTIAAARITRLNSTLDAQNQYLKNIETASSIMSTSDSTLGSIYDLLSEDLLSLVSECSQSTTDTATLTSSATLVDSLFAELVSLANTEYMGTYVFSGTSSTTKPYTESGETIQYNGNQEVLTAQVAAETSVATSLTNSEIFGTGTGCVNGSTDLAPAATIDTQLSDLSGSLGNGISLGTISITGSSIGSYEVNLSDCTTLGDIIDTVNDVLPNSMTMSLSSDGSSLVLTSTLGGETISVSETGSGTTAHDLGLYTKTAQAGPLTGTDLGMSLKSYTSVNSLNGGTGIDLTSGLIITNGSATATIDFSVCETMQDIINAINTSGTNVQASINKDGTGINVVSLTAGTTLTIGENGGTTAKDLGIRTMTGETTLSSLNNGEGVDMVDGADFTITASDGTSFDVDISNAKTVQEVIDAINSAASTGGISVTASLATTGNGIVLTDNTGGTGSFSVARANSSNAAEDLGILQSVNAGVQITGEDVSGVEEESIFSYLVDLREAMQTGDTTEIAKIGEKIEAYLDQLATAQGKLGYMEQAMSSRQTQLEDSILTTKSMISTLQDLDYTSAIVEYENLQTVLEATMQVSTQVMQMSILDYL
jgi:flagellar hook-associated protein 3